MSKIKLTVLYYGVCVTAQALFFSGFADCDISYTAIVAAAFSLFYLLFADKAPSLFFVLGISAASGGLVIQSSSVLMLIYSGLLLVSHDLCECRGIYRTFGDSPETSIYIIARLKILALVFISASAIILTVRHLEVVIPFWPMLFVLVAVFISTGKLTSVLIVKKTNE